jgi:hypothetical protein
MNTIDEKQALAFLEKTGCKMEINFKENRKYFPNDKEPRDVYEIKITRGREKWSFEFVNSIYNTGIKPTSYDVLACLTKYEVGTFDDFCDKFGYDFDSEKSEKTYNAVKEEWLNVCRIWNQEEIEELQLI